MILGLDPGTTCSGVVWYDPDRRQVVEPQAEMPNPDVLELLRRAHPSTLVVSEWIESFGMAVGAEVFLTCRWIGRFEEARAARGGVFETVTRRAVKLNLCGSMQAKDTNIRQAILDRFGGNRQDAIGTKKDPKALYGVASHAWSALAVVLTHLDATRARAA